MVIVIITILAGVVTVSLVRRPDEARAAATRMQLQQIRTALQIYRTEQGSLPTQEQGLEALVAKPTAPPGAAGQPAAPDFTSTSATARGPRAPRQRRAHDAWSPTW